MDQILPRGTTLPTPTQGGMRMRDFLDSPPIETRCLLGRRIVWQTGQQDEPDGVGPESHTHCSTLVVAVALCLDIYILRPPHHSQELLTNAQVARLGGAADFLGPPAASAHWRDLGGGSDGNALTRAVAASKQGKLVLADYQQPPVTDPTTDKSVQRPGHVVLVRPQVEAIATDGGPLVAMAGDQNWRPELANSPHDVSLPLASERLAQRDPLVRARHQSGTRVHRQRRDWLIR